MQAGKDQLDTRDALLRMNIHRHSATIIADLKRIVLMQHHTDAAGMPGECLVDTVVDDFLRQVVGTRGVGVHARSAAHRVQAAEYFQRVGIIGIGHRASGYPRSIGVPAGCAGKQADRIVAVRFAYCQGASTDPNGFDASDAREQADRWCGSEQR